MKIEYSSINFDDYEKYFTMSDLITNNKLFKSCLEKIYALTLNHGLMIEIIEKVMKRVK